MPLDHILTSIFLAILGILGLFVAAGAVDGYMYFAGLAVFFGTLFVILNFVEKACSEKWGH